MEDYKNIKKFKQRVPEYIELAKKLGKDASQGKIELTTDIKDIEKIDEVASIIKNLYVKKLIEYKVMLNTTYILGVLLGEMIINEEGGKWLLDENGFPYVEIEKGTEIPTSSYIYNIMLEEEAEGVVSKVSLIYDSYKAIKEYHNLDEEERSKIEMVVSEDEDGNMVIKSQHEINQEKNDEKKLNETIVKKEIDLLKILKYIVGTILLIFGVGTLALKNKNIYYVPLGMLVILLGLMALPIVTKYTKQYKTYTKYKALTIISVVVIIAMLSMKI